MSERYPNVRLAAKEAGSKRYAGLAGVRWRHRKRSAHRNPAPHLSLVCIDLALKPSDLIPHTDDALCSCPRAAASFAAIPDATLVMRRSLPPFEAVVPVPTATDSVAAPVTWAPGPALLLRK